jgi:hypothetical protein
MRGVRWLVPLAIACLAVAGCVPNELDQPTSGDGWRLIGWTRGGEPAPPTVGGEVVELLGQLDLLRMSRPVVPTDPSTELDVVVTHVVSGSCPHVRFDGFSVDADAAIVVAHITDREDLFSPFGSSCTADANPVMFWLAVELDGLPDSFVLSTDEAPGVTTPVDLGR